MSRMGSVSSSNWLGSVIDSNMLPPMYVRGIITSPSGLVNTMLCSPPCEWGMSCSFAPVQRIWSGLQSDSMTCLCCPWGVVRPSFALRRTGPLVLSTLVMADALIMETVPLSCSGPCMFMMLCSCLSRMCHPFPKVV